jgi:molybdate transport system regulatory protein
LSIELSIRLDLPDGSGHVGPGKIELLRRIDRHRSIAAAARSMAMSYRRAWLLVQELNELFAEPVVEKWLGGRSRGGASLTPAGERLIATYEAVVLASARTNDARLRKLERRTRRRAKSGSRRQPRRAR